MPVDIFGEKLSSIGFFDLGYKVDNLALISIDDNNFPALVQTYQIGRSERVQPIQCFNDMVHIYCFGKKPMTGNISGFALLDNDKLKDLIEDYLEKYRAYKSSASPIKINTLHGETLKAIMVNFVYAANAERPVLVSFTMDFIALGLDDTTYSSQESAATAADIAAARGYTQY